MNIKKYLENNILYLDGAMGTLLQERGLEPGELPEAWNIKHGEIIKEIHKSYYNAGSNVVSANTFGANILKFSQSELESIIASAIKIAREAGKESVGAQEKFVALDIGPTGRLLAPYGDLDFEEAVKIFSETVKLGAKYGADCVFIETMNDSYETKAALLAAKENCDLPVFVSNAYGEDAKLMTGANPAAMVAMLEGLGADAIGVNCSYGPKALKEIVREYLKYSSLPIIFKPNAGLPQVIDGKTVYNVSPEEFSHAMCELAIEGVRAMGGCCGSTPEHIKALVSTTKDIKPLPIEEKNFTSVSSYTHAVFFDETPILIGERINPTGKKKLKEALRSRDMNYILSEGTSQSEAGAHILDVNVGLPDIDEKEMLTSAVCELQAVTDLPLQIDSANSEAMESALRRYNGKAMINSVNGKKESMDSVFPLAKKYGGLIVALTLDEKGIPESAEGRLEIAEKILFEAEKYGISRKNIIFDPLALTISADNSAAIATLRALRLIRERLGCHTSLGVSNVSFGLPQREFVTSAFFTLAMQNGLSAAIMNPYSLEMKKAYYSFLALMGKDESCQSYIAFAENVSTESVISEKKALSSSENDDISPLKNAVIKGLRTEAGKLTREFLSTLAPLEIVEKEIIPALDRVGEAYEAKKLYLPQLLMSAEAAKEAFEVIKSALPSENSVKKGKFVIATVKGDIHDIGKNIVKLLLENYGFEVIDLGRDVAPEAVVNAVIESGAKIVGLSALMTTTVPAMEETIKQLRAAMPDCKIVVGGAVLTKTYAEKIGADKYASDAMETVRYAEEFFASQK